MDEKTVLEHNHIEHVPLQEVSALPLRAPSRKPAPPRAPSIWSELGALAVKILVITVILTLIFTFFYGFHRTTDPDMTPMVKTGDLVLFYRLGRDYVIGDLLLLDFQGERQIRRVVARAGDTVDITESGLVVNGSLQQELDIFQQTWRYENSFDFPLTVGQGQVFVLGDAREGATDSRVYGSVNTEDTLGTVITIIRRRNL
ncbi:MAG: signal peptidase I [Oscillospiraceae bacterium]|nr:signal peptidase I [Oscillospiraceae bacterium]